MIKELQNLIDTSNNIVAITGAGISTNSGIPDFRGPNGLYNRKDIDAEKLFDINYFRHDPTLFYNNIGSFWDECRKAAPTKGHLFLKQLEDIGKLKIIVSQNIDGLHEKAGNKNIINVHGDFNNFKCVNCGAMYPQSEEIFRSVLNKKIPLCKKCDNIIKPEIVFFGEAVPGITESINYIQQADLILTIGTSLQVYPVAGLVVYLPSTGKLCIINKGTTPFDERADLVIDEDIDKLLSQITL